MNDPYRLVDDAPDRAPRRALRPVLWLVLVLSAAANMVVSTGLHDPLVGSVFGVAALASAAGLIVDHYRHRRATT